MAEAKFWVQVVLAVGVITLSAVGIYATAHPEISCAATPNRVWLSDARACLPLNAFVPAK